MAWPASVGFVSTIPAAIGHLVSGLVVLHIVLDSGLGSGINFHRGGSRFLGIMVDHSSCLPGRVRNAGFLWLSE